MHKFQDLCTLMSAISYDAEGLSAELEENGRLVSSDSEAAIAKSCIYGFCNLRITAIHLMKWAVN